MAVTAAQATILTELAQSKNKFLMEGVWTRFQPVSYAVQALLGPDSLLGEIRGVQAELCIDFEVDTLPKNHRMVDLDLAGGALLDLGPYPWVWIALILFPEPSSSTTPHKIPKISASVIKSTSGADASTIAVIQVPRADGKVVHATLNCSMVRRTNQQRSVLVECEKGFLEIEWFVLFLRCPIDLTDDMIQGDLPTGSDQLQSVFLRQSDGKSRNARRSRTNLFRRPTRKDLGFRLGGGRVCAMHF